MLKVALVQSDPVWEDTAENLRRAEKFVAQSDAELIVFPEMFTTGFTMNPAHVAEPMSGATVATLKNISVKYDKAIMGSVVITEKGHYYNRMLFITPDGNMDWSDKRHLFRMSGENGAYTPGTERDIWTYKGIRILPAICYDLRFPVWLRNRGDYDMIVVSAAWPAARAAIWNTLLRARAIENLCYVAGVNCCGDDPNVSYNGGSALVDFMGNDVAAAKDASEQVVTGYVDLNDQVTFREKFPAWLDADNFTLIP